MKTLLLVLLLASSAALTATTVQAPPPCTSTTHHFVLEVMGADGEPQRFKGAVSYDGELELIDATTPYRSELTGSRLVAMLKSETAKPIRAALLARQGDTTALIGHVTGPSAAIYESVSCEEPLIRAFGPL